MLIISYLGCSSGGAGWRRTRHPCTKGGELRSHRCAVRIKANDNFALKKAKSRASESRTPSLLERYAERSRDYPNLVPVRAERTLPPRYGARAQPRLCNVAQKRPHSFLRETAVSSAKDRGLSAKRPRSFFAPSGALSECYQMTLFSLRFDNKRLTSHTIW